MALSHLSQLILPAALALVLDSSGMLQILSEMSWDTLLLLVGLAFVAVAIVGNISGKITPGKEGRIAAAICGICLIAAGVWYHGVLHSFKITGVDVTTPDSQSGKCPMTVPLQAVADATGSGDVIYNFQFSTGNGSALQHTSYSRSGSQILTGAWEVRQSIPDAWIELSIAAPVKRLSPPSLHFSVTCESPEPPAGASAQAPPLPTPTPTAPQTPAPQTSTTDTPAAATPAAAPAVTPAATPTAMAAKVPFNKAIVRSVSDFADSVVIDSATPAPGTNLKRGAPIPFDLVVTYNLVSADSAILSISTAQLRASPAMCSGNGELSDAVEVPIQRGKHAGKVHVTWSGDTGLSTKGRVYGSGFVAFTPMFWASENGHRRNRIGTFPVDTRYCYAFGP
jgi:hypothetical protein